MLRRLEFLKIPSLQTLVLLWLGWALVLLAFQYLAPMRLTLARPDNAVSWTANETRANSQDNKPYLLLPFMNEQVSWDSEFYLSIAAMGYDDPNVRSVRDPKTGASVSLNYAFFPLYPFLMRVVGIPFRLFGMKAIASSTIAGVLVSLLGTLAALVALWDLTREELGEAGGIRTAFYLLIFPSGFFLAQVYTEGLFVGLAFSALALCRRKNFWAAAILAVFATWTRAVGVLLIIPLAWAWGQHVWQTRKFNWYTWLLLGGVLLPLIAYGVWRFSSLGTAFTIVEEQFFGRELFAFDKSFTNWQTVWKELQSPLPARRIYYWLEITSIGLAILASLFTLKRYFALAVFSLAVIVVSVTSGQAQSMIRYMLVVPTIYIFLSNLGRAQSFDRVWTLASVLLCSLLTLLFTFDLWVA